MYQEESELDRINRYYKNRIVTLIPTRTAIDYTPDLIPHFCTGLFLEAMESGIWLLSLRTNKKDFFYHDKIVKIEENELIDPNDLNDETKSIVYQQFKEYDQRKKSELEMFDKMNPNNDKPDVSDASDTMATMSMIERVQQMVEQSKKDNFLEERINPSEHQK